MSKNCLQIAYCDSKFWNEQQSLTEQVEQTFRWYLLSCPFAGIKDLASARRRAIKLKSKYGARAQVIILGKVEGQYERCAADFISGITVLSRSGAMKCMAPSRIFTSKGPVFYPDLGGVEGRHHVLTDPSAQPLRHSSLKYPGVICLHVF